jgi:excinuclease UvrABC helicase subunit UvrB
MSTKHQRRSTSLAESGLSTATILDIVDRLGLVDLIVDQLKVRLEKVDIDDVLDEIADYLKKNPEVLVVSLGAVTIAAGALVYLNRRK